VASGAGGLLAAQIETLVGEDEAYEQAHRRALAQLERGLPPAVLRDLWAERAGVLSTQVLQEFYVNATRKLKTPQAKPLARSVVETYAAWCVDGITPTDVAAACQLEDRARIGFWDALILAVAVRSGARRVLSEDLNSGHAIAGLTIHNPFVG
jgi:predicted nucleic acid-binding protein